MTSEGGSAALHRCTVCRPVPVGTPVERLPFRTIDLHCHIFVPEVEALVADHPVYAARKRADALAIGDAARDVNAGQFAALMPKFLSVEERLRDMDAMGVDVQLVSPSPTQYHYWAEPALAKQIVALQNEKLIELRGHNPDRFSCLGAVSLQDPHEAADQLENLVRDRGFKGAEISTLVEDRDLADRFFDPFWTRAEALGALLFIHPWGTTMGSRLAQHYLLNTIGQPLETTICLSKLIFGGTLDRYPRLKLLAAHGGGYLPGYIGRSDHAHGARPDAGSCARAPSDYLRQIWFDSVIHGRGQLEALIRQVGADRIVVGTDYPFDMGEYDLASLLAGIPETEQLQILGGNASALLGIDLQG